MGRTKWVEDHDWERQELNYTRLLMPQAITPGVAPFRLPDECPEGVAHHLKLAFALYWLDGGSCANRLRVAAESILTDRGVALYPKTGKRRPLTFSTRIGRFASSHPDLQHYLDAVRWLGNAGSHSGPVGVSDSDILHAFEIFEHLLDQLYVRREQRLRNAARSIARRKGKPRR
jgi:hypothetical protein